MQIYDDILMQESRGKAKKPPSSPVPLLSKSKSSEDLPFLKLWLEETRFLFNFHKAHSMILENRHNNKTLKEPSTAS